MQEQWMKLREKRITKRASDLQNIYERRRQRIPQRFRQEENTSTTTTISS